MISGTSLLEMAMGEVKCCHALFYAGGSQDERHVILPLPSPFSIPETWTIFFSLFSFWGEKKSKINAFLREVFE